MTIDPNKYPALSFAADPRPTHPYDPDDPYELRYGEPPWPGTTTFSERLATELAARDAEMWREAQVEVLEIAADHELADVELSSPLGPMHLAGMRAGIEIARETLERLAIHLRNPQPATDAEQAEEEKAEDALPAENQ